MIESGRSLIASLPVMTGLLGLFRPKTSLFAIEIAIGNSRYPRVPGIRLFVAFRYRFFRDRSEISYATKVHDQDKVFRNANYLPCCSPIECLLQGDLDQSGDIA